MAPVESGEINPTSEFDGTVFFKELSNVATEISGKVEEVLFEEGDHVEKGAAMVRLDDELLRSELDATRALYRQRLAELNQEETRLKRAELLIEQEVTTPQEYDDIRFTVASYEQGVAAAQADVRRLEIELEKKVIYAPFDGVVLDRNTELGEWKGSGEAIGQMALDGVFDVIANIPEEVLPYAEPGVTAEMQISGERIKGEIVPSSPRGDINSRTFPVKIRVTGHRNLAEGMSAIVRMPTGEQTQSLLVSRDAVLLDAGRHIVVTVRDGHVQRLPVTVVGYVGSRAGLKADGLTADMQVAVKGHERVQDGQPAQVVEGN